MKIFSIDTSCDETACSITDDTKVLTNIVWSQAKAHAKFGGVMPSLAQRMHEERIDFVVKKALGGKYRELNEIDTIAVTIGPGLSIALEVGIKTAREMATKYNKKIVAVNHLEGHILSPFANNAGLISILNYPALGLVVSGGNTQLISIKEIGKYEILAQTTDDALGEALDKAARMLGLGYPGGAVLEKFARKGNPKTYSLPIPIAGREERKIFTYSGLKTAMSRLVESQKPLTAQKIYDLAACFQDTAFTHLIRIVSYIISRPAPQPYKHLLLGGGVAANVELRKRLRRLGKNHNLTVHFPYSNKLCGDNAGMIGIAAYFKSNRNEYISPNLIDRNPRAKLTA